MDGQVSDGGAALRQLGGNRGRGQDNVAGACVTLAAHTRSSLIATNGEQLSAAC